MLKNTKKIERVISKWLRKEFDNSLSAFMGTDFSYYFHDNKIEFSIVVSEKMNKYFLEFIENRFNVKFNDCFLISLLHEVGHHFTIMNIDDNTYDYCQDVKTTLTGETKEEVFTYFNLEDEIIATEWAVNYYLTNKSNCDKFMKRAEKAIADFIVLNGIEV